MKENYGETQEYSYGTGAGYQKDIIKKEYKKNLKKMKLIYAILIPLNIGLFSFFTYGYIVEGIECFNIPALVEAIILMFIGVLIGVMIDDETHSNIE